MVTMHHPTTIAEAADLLARDSNAMCLAGGASLVAMLNARLVQPSSLIDLRNIVEISGIAELPDGSVRIGAFTRHVQTATDDRLKLGARVVCEAARRIANVVIRNMGTMGGSIALSDPGADYPAALVAAGAEIELTSVGGTRRMSIQDFFLDWYTTDLQEGELVSAFYIPPAPAGTTGFYVKHARVEGDFATASLAGVLSMNSDGRCGYARLVLGACGPTPVMVDAANERITSGIIDEKAIADVAGILAAASDPVDDTRGSARYRRQLVPALIAQGLTIARKNFRL